MSLVHAVEVPRLPVSRLEPVIGALRYAELAGAADRIRPVLAGRTVWNVNSTALPDRKPPSLVVEALTERERDVLRLVGKLLSTAEIADKMFVSVNTVKSHLRSSFRKLGVADRRDAVRRARETGLL